ncbi:MAG: nucleotidyltransferase family protein [Gemmataceae bacterium]|nr:nucleotidyltransferase family protein [Gemmataceae bacterium]MCI0738245.1 nucleotidyltransferase family protein [Gemmataceae bacterium]
MLTYEQKLDRDISWALLEGSMHFEKESAVHKALRKITKRLEELGIAYALVGGLAMFLHGFRRFTEDVDLLVTRKDLAEIHLKLEGLGYVPPFSGSKHLRDVEHGVRIEFLVTGDYPGDGKPKSIAFPEPTDVATEIDGIRVLRLPELINLKLASGMTSPGRVKDIADVQQLIFTLNLPRDFGDQLNPFVKDKFCELWEGAEFERSNQRGS